MQYEMVIFSLSIYLYCDMDFCLAELGCGLPGRRFITIHWEDKQFLFTSRAINFYSIFSQNFLFICNYYYIILIFLFIYSLIKPILHNQRNKIGYPLEKKIRNICSLPLPFDGFSSYPKETFPNQVLYPSFPSDPDAPIYLSVWLASFLSFVCSLKYFSFNSLFSQQ